MPSLKDFHYGEPWKLAGYDRMYENAIKDGLFGLGMINPKTKKFMYYANEIDNIDSYYFCFQTAAFVCSWIENCITHSKPNRFAKFPLHESQRKFFSNLYGWKRISDGLRRYAECFKYIPRKNSKTFDIGCLVHIGMMLDGEAGTDIFSVAKDKEQAKLVQDVFVGSIKNDQERPELCTDGRLARYYEIHGQKNILAVTAENHTSTYKALSSDEGSAHGKMAHYGLCDEIHTWPHGDMFDVLETSMGTRAQPLMICITTADFAQQSFCNEKLKEAKSICDDPNEDENFLPILYYASHDEFGDNWEDPKVWLRVNPLLGDEGPLYMRYFERKYIKAKKLSIKLNAFKRLHLNICTKAESAAYDMTAWDKGLDLPEDTQEIFKVLGQPVPTFLKGAKCYGGFDAAYKWDLSAFVLDFPDYNYVLCFNWVPKNHPEVDQYKREHGKWLRQNGQKEIDFDRVAEDMNTVLSHFNIIDVGFDNNASREIIKTLEGDPKNCWNCFTITPNFTNLSEPIKNTIGSVEAGTIKHNGNTCFAWQLSNTSIKEGNNNEYLFVKFKGIDARTKKIDAADAWSFARCRRLVGEDEERDAYKDRFEETGSYF